MGSFLFPTLLAVTFLLHFASGFNRLCSDPREHICLYQGSRLAVWKLQYYRQVILLKKCPRRSHRRSCPSVSYVRRSWYVPVTINGPFSKTACCPGYTSKKSSLFEDEKCTKATGCYVTLPQHTPKICQKKRAKLLAKEKAFYKLNTKFSPYFTTTDRTFNEVLRRIPFDPIESHFFTIFNFLVKQVVTPYRNAMLKRFQGSEKPNYLVFNVISRAVRASLQAFVKKTRLPYFRQPSWFFKGFPDVTSPTFFNSDDRFTQVRLAGLSPRLFKRVFVKSHGHHPREGLELKTLENLVGKTRLLKLVQSVLKMTPRKAASENYLYVADFLEMRNLKENPDYLVPPIAGVFPGEKVKRTPLPFVPPIGIFASVPDNNGRKLEAIGIQESYNKKDTFTTPKSKRWPFAKQKFTYFDRYFGTIVDHLFGTHYRMEQYCLALFRHLSSRHPLYSVLKWHCRGLVALNTGSFRNFLTATSPDNRISPLAPEGWVKAGTVFAKTWEYGSGLPQTAVKDRGLDDKEALPYFPFRDDSEKLMKILRRFACELSKRKIYPENEDIVRDYELQALAHELSAKGSGKVKGFPARFKRQGEVCKFIEVMLSMVVTHSAANYPVADYGTFSPLLPNRLYDEKTLLDRLPSPAKSTLRIANVMTLTSMRLDSLLDYAGKLPEESLRNVVRKYRQKLLGLSPQLRRVNIQRLKDKLLPYLYLDPRYITNSIST